MSRSNVAEVGAFPVPEEWGWPAGVNIFVGGCVTYGVRAAFGARAHAHIERDDQHYHWMCIKSPRDVLRYDGSPSAILLHELAHILTNSSHTLDWRMTLKAMGVQIHPRYIPGEQRVQPQATFVEGHHRGKSFSRSIAGLEAKAKRMKAKYSNTKRSR